MIAFIFPGQGSQQVGMGKALAEAYPEALAAFAEADAAFGTADGVALSTLCFEGPKEQLLLTEITQPALLTTSIAAQRVLAARGIRPAWVAGHSLGEYSANVAAGTMTLAEAVAIVRRRGRYMQEAVPVGEGAMAAVLGASPEAVRQACDESVLGPDGQREVVSPANFNSPGQIVIAGSIAAVARASARVKALGARKVVALSVSAPFHCALMRPAEERLGPELRALAVGDPAVPVVANVDGEPKRDGASAIDALVRQVSEPVQWEAVVRRLASEGVTTYVEVGSGSVLSGLVRKTHAEARVLQFGSPEDLEAVVTACST